MKILSDILLKGKVVLLRVDFNVPLDSLFNITDDSRMVSSVETIKKIIDSGGKAVIMSHLGRPKNGFENCFSLKHIVNHLSVLLNSPVDFSADCVGEGVLKKIKKMKNGDILLLENIRFHKEELLGDVVFAKELSKLGDVYVNDAFGSAHRKHASTSVIASFFPKEKCFGLLLSNEVENLNFVMENPKKPFTAVIGGAKITGKIDVIRALFNKVDNLIIGGGMAYTFVKALGGNTGKSLMEESKLVLAKSLIEEAKKKGVRLLLPSDSVNANAFNNDALVCTSDISQIPNDFMGLDIGPNSVALFSEVILNSKTIVWNGPMGVFEMQKFSTGTKMIGKAISLATQKGAFSLVGGGDSISAIKKFGFSENISYISTGGGAMLEYLEGKLLPGIKAIQN